MNDPRRHTHPPQRAVAFCDYALTDERFLEYVSICDFMSKWKKFAGGTLALLLIFTPPLVAEVIFGVPLIFVLWVAFIVGGILLIVLISMMQQAPTFWFVKRTRLNLTALYSKRLGVYPRISDIAASFSLCDGMISMKVSDTKVQAPLSDVRWVRKRGDLVIVGCLDDSRSLPPHFMQSADEYKAIPGVAFLASKLEGMDSEELIALLEGCARQHRRNYFWDWQPVGGQ